MTLQKVHHFFEFSLRADSLLKGNLRRENERVYYVEVYIKVRQACLVEGKSIRKAAEDFGLNRRTVKKMLTDPIPTGYQKKKDKIRPVLEPFIEMIHQIIEDDKKHPKKQRHTKKRIYERLKEEKGYLGSYSTVRKYVSKYRGEHCAKEVFCPLEHKPGEAQVDFGEALVKIGGVEQKCHLFIMSLPQSDACFVKAYPRENTEAFCDGHVAAFKFFGGVPLNILYDNTTLAVSFIKRKRKKTSTFLELQSHYLFEERFARIRKGSDKGSVENLVGYIRRNFLVPIPEFETFDPLNVYLETCSVKRQNDILQGHQEPIKLRLQKDKDVFLPLPEFHYIACSCQAGLVSSESLVRFKGNDYSVPVKYGHRDVWVKGYVYEVVISCGTEIIANHKRCYEEGQRIFNPLHYLPLLEKKTGAFDQAAPLSKWELPSVFNKLQTLLEKRDGKEGKREYVRVLRLLETYSIEQLENGVTDALKLGVLNIESIKHLLLCRLDKRPLDLNMKEHPHLPNVSVQITRPQDYSQLLEAAC